MVGIAQQLERRSVEAEAEGANPFTHPAYFFSRKSPYLFLMVRT